MVRPKSRRSAAATIRALATIMAVVIRPGTAASATWTVSGTVRRLGPASIITASCAAIPQACGDEFGLAGVVEADLGQPGLGNRSRDQPRRLPRDGQPGAFSQGGEGKFGSAAIRSAGLVIRIDPRQHRQAVIEYRHSLRRMEQFGNSQIESAPGSRLGQQAGRACDEERRQVFLMPLCPGGSDQFRADPSRIAQRNGQRRWQIIHDQL